VRGVQKHDLKKKQKVHVKNFFREIYRRVEEVSGRKYLIFFLAALFYAPSF
jgi:hypothetical protein